MLKCGARIRRFARPHSYFKVLRYIIIFKIALQTDNWSLLCKAKVWFTKFAK